MIRALRCGAEGIRTPDPLDAKGHLPSVPVASSSMVSACFPYTARLQSSRVTSCHLVIARVKESVRGQMRVKPAVGPVRVWPMAGAEPLDISTGPYRLP
jgi:hypothetical protein